MRCTSYTFVCYLVVISGGKHGPVGVITWCVFFARLAEDAKTICVLGRSLLFSEAASSSALNIGLCNAYDTFVFLVCGI